MAPTLRKVLYFLVGLSAAVIAAAPALSGAMADSTIVKIVAAATAVGILLSSVLHIPMRLRPLPISPKELEYGRQVAKRIERESKGAP